MNTTREFLKSATEQCHKDIEKQIGLTTKIHTLPDYTHLLKKYLTFYNETEMKLAAVQDLPIDIEFTERKKLPLLKKDLDYLQIREELSAPFSSPSIDSVAEAFGVLYVLEGSTLGGQLLKKHFQTALRIEPETGGAFFNAYGANTGVMWQKFIRVLEREINTPEQRQKAADAAVDTFKKLGNWLDS